MANTPTTTFTRADLDDFPDDGRRYELIDGELLVSPMARRRHQRVITRIAARIQQWIDGSGHGIIYAGVNVELAATTHLEPDVAWSSSEDDSGLGFELTPEFIVEVASPSTRGFDRGVKKDRYAATGCRELWLVDLATDEIEQYEVVDGAAGAPVVHGRGGSFTSVACSGASFSVDDLLCLRS